MIQVTKYKRFPKEVSHNNQKMFRVCNLLHKRLKKIERRMRMILLG